MRVSLKGRKMAKVSTEDLLETFKEMTLIELSEFVKSFEETFGVTAAAPVAVAAAAPAAGGGAAAAAAPVKTEFDVVMTAFGEKKLDVVKVVKNLTGQSLMDAKKLVEAPPATIKAGVSEDEAKKVKAELEAAGATVELK